MKIRQSLALVLVALTLAACAAASGHHGPAVPASGAALAEEVRRVTSGFVDPAAARKAGYAPFLGCVSGPQEGAMGIHFVHGDLVGDGVLDASRPEALMYEPRDGKLHLVGVEYIVLADAWNAKHKSPPMLMGQSFHYTGTPNRYGIPAFYALHVWAWKPNPRGMFVDWNPNVSCEGYAG
ncbi:MAG TPA: hypothetical protein VEA38_16350 [Terriglobales bacterium]|nr:hypothetical protein [Terriglobales bacterium]